MSKLYHLNTVQKIPAAPEEVWDFIASPHNLERITPPEMQFRTLTEHIPEKMFAGMIISYSLRPFPGIAMRWVTEITHVKEGSYFVDEQRFGPYAFWHHLHRIEAIEGGTCMWDELNYKIPLGPLGDLAQALLVRKKLNAVFEFRRRRIEELFGRFPGA
jgi:ligand-binding SRPBCC domain-containing protein